VLKRQEDEEPEYEARNHAQLPEIPPDRTNVALRLPAQLHTDAIYRQSPRIPNTFPPLSVPAPPIPPPQRVAVPFPLSNAVQSICDTVRDVLSKLKSANQMLLEIRPNLDNLEKTINSLRQLPVENTEHREFISVFMASFLELNLRGVWDGLGETWTKFWEKIHFHSGHVDDLRLKFCAPMRVPP